MFDVIFLETVGFDNLLRAYEVGPQASGIVSVIVYSFNDYDYIKVKGDILDLKD